MYALTMCVRDIALRLCTKPSSDDGVVHRLIHSINTQ